MSKPELKEKMLGALNQVIGGLVVLKTITLEIATDDELPEEQGLELLKAVKHYRDTQKAFEAIRDQIGA